MAYIHFRKLHEPSVKKTWVPKNRKYKWLFWASFLLNLVMVGKYLI